MVRLLLFLVLLATTARAQTADTARRIVAAAKAQVGVTVSYDPAYVSLAYPGGDVLRDRGVCTDVVIRALRQCGIDLQQTLHEDMAKNFSRYPQQWGLRKPDPNIDHRRVPNLRRYFERQGSSLAVSSHPEDYRPGDVVTCTVPPSLPHIMIVSDVPAPDDATRLQVIHNIGHGARIEDRLFEFPLTGHYRLR